MAAHLKEPMFVPMQHDCMSVLMLIGDSEYEVHLMPS